MSDGHPLRIWRDRIGLTQGELGVQLGVGGSQVSMIESGRRGASIEIAAKIVDLSDGEVPLDSLMASKREQKAAAA